MKHTLRPRLFIFLPFFIYGTLLLVLAVIGYFVEQILVRGGLVVVAILLIRETFVQLRKINFPKIEISDDKIIVPIIPKDTSWPVDLNGTLVLMPGFEYYGNLRGKLPFSDGKGSFVIPFKNITGIFTDVNPYAYKYLVIGTDFFNIHFGVRQFGRKRLEKFLSANLPPELMAPDVRLNSVLYKSHHQNLEQLLETLPEEVTLQPKDKKWREPVFAGLVFAFFLVFSLIGDVGNIICYSLFWVTMIVISVVEFNRTYGERELTVNQEYIQFRRRNKYDRIWWKDVQYCYLSTNYLILWNQRQRFILSKDILASNRLSYFLLEDKRLAGDIQGKWALVRSSMWNKCTKYLPEK